MQDDDFPFSPDIELIGPTHSAEEITAAYEALVSSLESKVVPETYPLFLCDDRSARLRKMGLSTYDSLGPESLLYRDSMISLGSYPLIAYEWVRPLAKWIGKRKCLEVMCGNGMLAKALQNCGVDLMPTDDMSWQGWNEHTWTQIEMLDCVEAIKRYGRDSDIILCSWPPLQNNAAYQALRKMRDINPHAMMVYIGEQDNGACADDQFFDALDTVRDDAFYQAFHSFKRCFGMKDGPILIR